MPASLHVRKIAEEGSKVELSIETIHSLQL
jgi:hypothetical protein